MVDRLKSGRRQKTLFGAALAGSLAIALGLGGYVAFLQWDGGRLADAVTCRDVHRLAKDYLDGGLDEDTSQSVRAHLAVCASCRSHVENLAGHAAPDGEPSGLLQPQFRHRRPGAFRGRVSAADTHRDAVARRVGVLAATVP